MRLTFLAQGITLALLAAVIPNFARDLFSGAAANADSNQVRVEDIFGRPLNERGITLVDRDGYMANPLVTSYLLPPANAVFPAMATLKAAGVRLYFDAPSEVTSNGPSKTISFKNATNRVPIRLSIFPDHDSVEEQYLLTI